MVAGQDHHRHAGIGKQPSGAVDQLGAEAVGFERVAGQQDNVGPQRPRRRQHRREPGRAVAAIGRSDAPVIDMNIGAVNQHHLRGASDNTVLFW